MNTPHYKGGYPARARRNIQIASTTKQGQYLIYAALEYRCAIERLLFMYMSMTCENMSKSLEVLYRAVDLKKAILKLDPDFIIKIRFVGLWLMAKGEATKLEIPDLDRLSTIYGKLGSYLHSIKRPKDAIENPAWWKRLSELLSETDTILAPLLEIPLGYFTPNEIGRKLLDACKKGHLSDEAIIAEMRHNLGAQPPPSPYAKPGAAE